MSIKYLPRIFISAFLFFGLFGCKENSEKKISEPEESVETFKRNNQIMEYDLVTDSLISKSIQGGDLFIFNFNAYKNQFVHIVAEQKEIDFKLTLKRPESDSLLIFDTPNGQRGKEYVYFISQQSGKYQLELKPFSDYAEPAEFEIVLKTIRNATESDRNWMQLYERMKAANQLRGKRETLPKAIEEFNTIIPKWRAMGDTLQEAIARRSLGYALRSMGQNEEAIKTFESVLLLWKDLGETRYEAFTYLILAGIYKSEKNYDKAIPLTQKAIE
ncbi:MAG: tetratricopeptide repeat protein, partial [Aquaticitalea sp.]